MNTLIVYAHPTHTGHHGYFLDQLISVLDNKNIDYEVLDLYNLNYDPILKAEELGSRTTHKINETTLDYQEKVKNADKLIFIYPTWWQGMPAILKGFFDRVFASGFAFIYKGGLPVALLKGKKAAVFSATGGPKVINKFLLSERGMKVITKNILGFCGIKAKGFSIGSARELNDNHKKQIITVASSMVSYLYK
ncbi:MAG: NAD(P)H-dependent oxidoreductase [Patescibacteria group bacterium]